MDLRAIGFSKKLRAIDLLLEKKIIGKVHVMQEVKFQIY